MRDAFVITPAGYDLHQAFVAASGLGMRAVLRGELLSIGEGREYVDLTEVPEVSEHFDDEERAAIDGCGPAPRFYRLRFHDPAFAARVLLELIPRRPDFMLDNDHGLLLPLDCFTARYQRGESWDWSLAEGFL